MQKGIPLRLIETPEMDSPAPASQAHGGHELEDAHLSGGTDPHTWMNPQNAKLQAAIARDALSSIDSGNAAYYAANYDKLAAELDSLDRELTRILEPVRDKEIFVYHPAFGYFADAYGLRQVSVEMGGKEPGARQLSRLIDLARKRNVKVIFVQPEYSDKSARALADQVGAIVVAIDALAEEYTANLRTIGRTIERALLRQH
jgi:zinc transport system substrate-binding protein